MRLTFSFFFLVLMTLNVALPVVGQLRGEVMFERSDMGADDTDEESKNEKEKEKEKEKEPIASSYYSVIKPDGSNLEQFRKSLFSKYNLPVSELYASLPELPPDA